MSDEKTYSDAEIPGKIAEHGLTAWYLEEGWLSASSRLRAGPPRSSW